MNLSLSLRPDKAEEDVRNGSSDCVNAVSYFSWYTSWPRTLHPSCTRQPSDTRGKALSTRTRLEHRDHQHFPRPCQDWSALDSRSTTTQKLPTHSPFSGHLSPRSHLRPRLMISRRSNDTPASRRGMRVSCCESQKGHVNPHPLACHSLAALSRRQLAGKMDINIKKLKVIQILL